LSRGAGAEASARVAWGALVGKAVAAAVKVALGLVIAAWIMVAALR
jgi:hypothetical protein